MDDGQIRLGGRLGPAVYTRLAKCYRHQRHSRIGSQALRRAQRHSQQCESSYTLNVMDVIAERCYYFDPVWRHHKHQNEDVPTVAPSLRGDVSFLI
jgi:hypothetical protein